MSASVASLATAKEARKIVEAETVPAMAAATDDKARLAIALEALSAIAGENDLTCVRTLFRMRRQAEKALLRIRGSRNDQHTLF
ncbi:conserved hypothetical protein [Solidesulfovibrio fructosivorans JJ]]|uniref:Uncharacterized protein n=1 Tax=Solidesulfovibrio fructosivorans JJ] TaxID=596151 RepID=E1JSG5_SOLFR|nr:hypothetical protein [Solidesulfovibrio fructosivorans]EFL52934.1 conserved hypothetical protein [Solidesulfovibrio fructosivorans JJ]]